MRKNLVFLTIGTLLTLLLVSTPAGAKTVPLPGLMKPAGIAVDDGQIYISDGTTVHSYSL